MYTNIYKYRYLAISSCNTWQVFRSPEQRSYKLCSEHHSISRFMSGVLLRRWAMLTYSTFLIRKERFTIYHHLLLTMLTRDIYSSLHDTRFNCTYRTWEGIHLTAFTASQCILSDFMWYFPITDTQPPFVNAFEKMLCKGRHIACVIYAIITQLGTCSTPLST